MLYWFNNLWWGSVGAVWMLEKFYMPRVAFAYLMVLIWLIVPFLAIMFAISIFIRGAEAMQGGLRSLGRYRGRSVDEPVFNFSHRGVRGNIVPNRKSRKCRG